MPQRPNVLVCNDDGIHAPGVRALIVALHQLDLCDLFICCPASEQSGKSQAITLSSAIVTRHLHGVHSESLCCIEVHGTPADAVMVGLYSNTFSKQVSQWDLVVSGINRGDNLGLHVIYSGTVGAAREAASIVKGALARWSGNMPPELLGNVVNVNIPGPSCSNIKGLFLARMSRSSVLCGFRNASGKFKSEALRRTDMAADDPDVKVLTNTKTSFREDMTVGCDFWAVKHGYISITPLDLMQDFSLTAKHLGRGREFVSIVWEIMKDVSSQLDMVAECTDTPKL